MKHLATISSLAAIAAAAADPQITPRAELAPRQNADPAFLGWVSASATFSESRSCDFPATLSRSGSLAQCCSPSSSCVFWSSCSVNVLFASQTSLVCDQGFCNTAVLVSSVGANGGQNYLGCWPTRYGQSAFTIVSDIGSAPVGRSTAAGSSGASSARLSSGGSSTSRSALPSVTGSAASSASIAAQSSGAANAGAVQPLTGVFGLVAIAFGML